MGFQRFQLMGWGHPLQAGSTAQNTTGPTTASQQSEDHWMLLWKEMGKRCRKGRDLWGEKSLSLTDWIKVLFFLSVGSIGTQDLTSDLTLMLRCATQSTAPVQCHSFSLE